MLTYSAAFSSARVAVAFRFKISTPSVITALGLFSEGEQVIFPSELTVIVIPTPPGILGIDLELPFASPQRKHFSSSFPSAIGVAGIVISQSHSCPSGSVVSVSKTA